VTYLQKIIWNYANVTKVYLVHYHPFPHNINKQYKDLKLTIFKSISTNQAYLEFEAVQRHLFTSESTVVIYFQ